MKRLLIFCITIGLLAACAADLPVTPVPTTVAVVMETAVFTITPTKPAPTSTASATASPLPLPTAAPTSSPTQLPTLTPFPSATASPTPLPTIIPTPVTIAAVPPAIWTTIGTPMPSAQAVLSPENVTQIQELGRWGKGKVIDAAYSPDGTQLIVATALGVYVYDAETAVQLSFIPVENIQLASMAVSPDGQLVAMGIAPDRIEIRQLNDGSLLNIFTTLNGIQILTFTADGQYLFAPYAAWRMNDGTRIPNAYDINIFSADGETVVTYQERAFEIAKLTTENGINTSLSIAIPDDSDNPTHMTLSPDGKFLAVGGWGVTAGVYQVSDGALLCRFDFTPPTASVPRRHLSSRAYNNSPGRYRVIGLKFTPDSQILAVGSGFEEVTLWEMDGCRLQQRISDANGDIVFSDDGNRMAVWSDTLTQWDMPSGTRLNQLKQHAGWISDLEFTLTSSHLAIASNLLYVRGVIDGGLLTSFPHETRHLAITPDDQTLLFTSGDNLIFHNLNDDTSIVVDASDGSWGIAGIALSAGGHIVAATSHDDAVRIWRVNDGELLREGYSMIGQAIAFSPTEPLFAVGDDGYIEIWASPPLQITDGETWVTGEKFVFRLAIQEENYAILRSLSFSPDGTQLAAGLSNGTILVWQMSDGMLVNRLQSHTHYVEEIDFSPNGELLASVSYDGTLKFWRVADGVLLNTIQYPPAQLLSAEFSPNGRLLATGSRDGLVRLWGVPSLP